jgi:ATP-dependent Lon protease
VEITHNLIKRTLELPAPPAAINSEDRVGESLALGVNAELGVGGLIPVQATRIGAAGSGNGSAVSMVHATGNLEKVMDESRRVATTAILHCANDLGIDPERVRDPVHLHFLGASTRKDGPSAGTAIALALASLLTDTPLRRDVAATGEVDTQGRIKGVGGLDAKLEIAASAGCRTVLVPEDNLTGPGGIDRLPEPLRRELQVLTFNQWRTDHEPFDFERHSLQVVTVEHILQAFEVAGIVASELDKEEQRCVDHARTMVPLQRDRQRCAVTVVVKTGSDVDPASFRSSLCERCSGCRMVVPIGMGDHVEASLSSAYPKPEIVEIEPGPDALGRVLARVAEQREVDAKPMVVVAPYFALRELDMESLDLPSETILFANNFLAQGLKLKGVKASLNRAVCRLLHYESSVLETFPLLARRNGIYVADLSLVPEKYRLDPGRCEELLERYLGAWLAVVEDRAQTAGAGTT